ncbi:type II toxin-antitoxin system RelE/ParE family toxin [Sphingomonas sp. HITSZ_GF]|uniref:type II toxin-antitoxin system RelE/ParE family toxin n=1 Tax=Sphingomonas sp. HITSZ_GF TaxID=3037247 RepID=UPI00240D6996|nr:type II toxin-antitoxin system RelE/ParE family toxin [Sphingomonas sp. HITSZ_GF]MDG2533959.1 type II toxin-antitoxin system RelE/ParE family toxin [Sphingomonas sp. HITSZ_GF]
MAEYRLSPRAQRDLEEVFDYTVERWGLPQALRYTDFIEAACAALAEAPRQAQDCAHIRPGYRRRSVEQHVIYFTVTAYGIAVIRILHQRMDAGRHL